MNSNAKDVFIEVALYDLYLNIYARRRACTPVYDRVSLYVCVFVISSRTSTNRIKKTQNLTEFPLPHLILLILLIPEQQQILCVRNVI